MPKKTDKPRNIETIKTASGATFKTFMVPRFAVRIPQNEAVATATLSCDAIDALASRWLSDVYAQAGKPNPWRRDDGGRH